MSERFYVAQCLPSQESIAALNLRNQKFETYYPTETKERRIKVRNAVRTTSHIVPLFPGYVFVAFDHLRDAWRSINGTRGVRRLLGEGEKPVAVPEGFVDELRRQCALGVFDQSAARDVIRAGESVRIESGSFAGLIGECIEARAKSVRVLLSCFGGAVRVTFSPDNVARV